MALPLIPDAVKTFVALWPALSVIYEALEYGEQKAVEYFEMEQDNPHPFLAPDIVRYQAKRLIASRSEEMQITVDDVSNIGLRIVYNSYWIWIMKTPDGELPLPKSPQKEIFYSQVFPLLVDPDTSASLLRPNTVVVWTAPRNYTSLSLKLVLPKSGDVEKAIRESYWDVRIPHPTEMMKFQMPTDADAATPEVLSAIENILYQQVRGEDDGSAK